MIIRWSDFILRIFILASQLIFNVLAYSFVFGIQIQIVNHIVV